MIRYFFPSKVLDAGLPSPQVRRVLAGRSARVPLAAAVLGLVAGSFLLLFTVQAVQIVKPLLDRERASAPGEFLVVSRKASVFGLLGGDQGFTDQEIAQVRAQPFVADVGIITLSQFRARLTGTESIPFTTELFFEAVPDRFLDQVPDGWQWRAGDSTVPVILSREFLALYNFGFAVAYRLPQLTPHTLQSLRLNILIEGPTGVERFVARIAGFSDRYTSLLVPESFLQWANSRFAPSAVRQTGRLVMRVPNPEQQQVARFLEEKGYDANRERLKSSRLWNLLLVLAGSAGMGGSLLTGLALLVAVLSFQLTISRSDRDIALLVHLGIAAGTLWNFFMTRALMVVCGSVFVGAVLAVVAAERVAILLAQAGISVVAGGWLLPLAAALGLGGVGLVVHGLLIHRHLRRVLS